VKEYVNVFEPVVTLEKSQFRGLKFLFFSPGFFDVGTQ